MYSRRLVAVGLAYEAACVELTRHSRLSVHTQRQSATPLLQVCESQQRRATPPHVFSTAIDSISAVYESSYRRGIRREQTCTHDRQHRLRSTRGHEHNGSQAVVLRELIAVGKTLRLSRVPDRGNPPDILNKCMDDKHRNEMGAKLDFVDLATGRVMCTCGVGRKGRLGCRLHTEPFY